MDEGFCKLILRLGLVECPLPGIWQITSPNEHVAGMTHYGVLADLKMVPVKHYDDTSATGGLGGPQRNRLDCSRGCQGCWKHEEQPHPGCLGSECTRQWMGKSLPAGVLPQWSLGVPLALMVATSHQPPTMSIHLVCRW